ncbi:MAG: hypothetical protein JNL83_27020 [Myxococcales bacterium]|nr:hypothetical protein [Myxococcales bacterium]
MRTHVIGVAVAVAALLAGSVANAERSALDALLARTDKVAREVAKIRGLPLKRPIPNEVVDKDELRTRLLAMAAEDKTAAETAAEGIALARWGMIPRSTDYKALLVDLLTEQIAGYYDPDTKKLTISRSAGDDPAWAEMVLAHEIDHGLQDQSFDLKKFEDLPPTEGDAAAARRALVEGDGIALMIEVMLARTGNGAPWSNPEVADSIEKAMTVPGNGDGLDKAPLAIRESMIFPYRSGLSFVAALRRRQPWSAVDAAYRKPPKSTEHILHPERYLAGDDPVPVAITQPSALRGFQLAHSTVWGELGWSLFLRTHGVDDHTAAMAAAGWGGDRAITYTRADDPRPDRGAGISRSEWDSEADALEAFEATEKALDHAIAGATIDHAGTRTRWMALDGTVSWIDRKGPSLVVVIGAPAWAAEALAAEVWTASSIVAPPPRTKPTKQRKTPKQTP